MKAGTGRGFRGESLACLDGGEEGAQREDLMGRKEDGTDTKRVKGKCEEGGGGHGGGRERSHGRAAGYFI